MHTRSFPGAKPKALAEPHYRKSIESLSILAGALALLMHLNNAERKAIAADVANRLIAEVKRLTGKTAALCCKSYIQPEARALRFKPEPASAASKAALSKRRSGLSANALSFLVMGGLVVDHHRLRKKTEEFDILLRELFKRRPGSIGAAAGAHLPAGRIGLFATAFFPAGRSSVSYAIRVSPSPGLSLLSSESGSSQWQYPGFRFAKKRRLN